MPRDWAALEDFILQRMGETRLPGLSLALVQDGEVIYARGFGYRDAERGLPVTPRTLFGIGSVTKSFTCLALLQLQERGLLRVDDPVEKYLRLNIRPHGEAIRLRHLMTHSSGIPALAYAEGIIRHSVNAGGRWLPMASTEDMLTFVNGAAEWVETGPGERWFYLNEGYVLLGGIIEAVSGTPYPAYIREHILQPLGMRRTIFGAEEFQRDEDAAVPYVVGKDKTEPGRYLFGQLLGDGGLISNAEDMAHYVAMLIDQGRGPEGRIISPESWRAMTQGYVAVPPQTYPAPEPASIGRYGYGVTTYPDFFGRRLVAHGGSVLVATAYMGFLPVERLGVIVLANGAGPSMPVVGGFALATVLEEDPWHLPALRFDRGLRDLAGIYETYRGTYQLTIRRMRGADFLLAEVHNRIMDQAVPLVPVALEADRARFFTLSEGRRLEIEFYRRNGEIELIYERYKLRRVGKA